MATGTETNLGRVYEVVELMSYTMFHERVQRPEGLRLVRTRRRKKGQGRTREFWVADGVEEVVFGAVSAGSSGKSSHRRSGVAER